MNQNSAVEWSVWKQRKRKHGGELNAECFRFEDFYYKPSTRRPKYHLEKFEEIE